MRRRLFVSLICFTVLPWLRAQPTCSSTGEWGPWGDWSTCPPGVSYEDIMNFKKRMRTCLPQPVGCSNSSTYNCPGTYSELDYCVTSPAPTTETTTTPSTTTTTTTTAAPTTTSTTTITTTSTTTTAAPTTTTTTTTSTSTSTTTTTTPTTTSTTAATTTTAPSTTTTTTTLSTTIITPLATTDAGGSTMVDESTRVEETTEWATTQDGSNTADTTGTGEPFTTNGQAATTNQGGETTLSAECDSCSSIQLILLSKYNKTKQDAAAVLNEFTGSDGCRQASYDCRPSKPTDTRLVQVISYENETRTTGPPVASQQDLFECESNGGWVNKVTGKSVTALSCIYEIATTKCNNCSNLIVEKPGIDEGVTTMNHVTSECSTVAVTCQPIDGATRANLFINGQSVGLLGEEVARTFSCDDDSEWYDLPTGITIRNISCVLWNDDSSPTTARFTEIASVDTTQNAETDAPTTNEVATAFTTVGSMATAGQETTQGGETGGPITGGSRTWETTEGLTNPPTTAEGGSSPPATGAMTTVEFSTGAAGSSAANTEDNRSITAGVGSTAEPTGGSTVGPTDDGGTSEPSTPIETTGTVGVTTGGLTEIPSGATAGGTTQGLTEIPSGATGEPTGGTTGGITEIPSGPTSAETTRGITGGTTEALTEIPSGGTTGGFTEIPSGPTSAETTGGMTGDPTQGLTNPPSAGTSEVPSGGTTEGLTAIASGSTSGQQTGGTDRGTSEGLTEIPSGGTTQGLTVLPSGGTGGPTAMSSRATSGELTTGNAGGSTEGVTEIPSGATGGTTGGLTEIPSGATGGTTEGLTEIPSGATGGTTEGLTDIPSGATEGSTEGLTEIPSGATGGTTEALTDIPSGATEGTTGGSTEGLTEIPSQATGRTDGGTTIISITGGEATDVTSLTTDVGTSNGGSGGPADTTIAATEDSSRSTGGSTRGSLPTDGETTEQETTTNGANADTTTEAANMGLCQECPNILAEPISMAPTLGFGGINMSGWYDGMLVLDNYFDTPSSCKSVEIICAGQTEDVATLMLDCDGCFESAVTQFSITLQCSSVGAWMFNGMPVERAMCAGHMLLSSTLPTLPPTTTTTTTPSPSAPTCARCSRLPVANTEIKDYVDGFTTLVNGFADNCSTLSILCQGIEPTSKVVVAFDDEPFSQGVGNLSVQATCNPDSRWVVSGTGWLINSISCGYEGPSLGECQQCPDILANAILDAPGNGFNSNVNTSGWYDGMLVLDHYFQSPTSCEQVQITCAAETEDDATLLLDCDGCSQTAVSSLSITLSCNQAGQWDYNGIPVTRAICGGHTIQGLPGTTVQSGLNTTTTTTTTTTTPPPTGPTCARCSRISVLPITSQDFSNGQTTLVNGFHGNCSTLSILCQAPQDGSQVAIFAGSTALDMGTGETSISLDCNPQSQWIFGGEDTPLVVTSITCLYTPLVSTTTTLMPITTTTTATATLCGTCSNVQALFLTGLNSQEQNGLLMLNHYMKNGCRMLDIVCLGTSSNQNASIVVNGGTFLMINVGEAEKTISCSAGGLWMYASINIQNVACMLEEVPTSLPGPVANPFPVVNYTSGSDACQSCAPLTLTQPVPPFDMGMLTVSSSSPSPCSAETLMCESGNASQFVWLLDENGNHLTSSMGIVNTTLTCSPTSTWTTANGQPLTRITCGVGNSVSGSPNTTTTLIPPVTTTTTEIPSTTTTTTLAPPTTTSTGPPDCTLSQWADWEQWSVCTDTCGSCGVWQRFRRCLKPADACRCNGTAYQKERCNTNVCKYPRNESCCSGYTPVGSDNTFVCVLNSTVSTS